MLFCRVFAIKNPSQTEPRRRSVLPVAKSTAILATASRPTKQAMNASPLLPINRRNALESILAKVYQNKSL
jgi:hypothetical protein